MHRHLKLLVLLWLILTLLPSLLQAQTQKFTISTSIQFPSEKINSFKNSMYKITPKATYNLNSNLSIGVFYSYLGGKTSNSLMYSNNETYLSKIYNLKNLGNFGGALGQYSFLNIPKLKGFIELESGFGTLKKETKNGWVYLEHVIVDNASDYREIDLDTFNSFISDWNIPTSGTPPKPQHAGYSTIISNLIVLISNINLGGRYDFKRGLGVELRVNNLISYTNSKDKQTSVTESDFIFIKNIPNNISLGISYSF